LNSLYTNAEPDTTARPERRGVSRRSVIEAAKEAVPVIDLADRLLAESGGRWSKVGGEWVTNCVLPGHRDRSPSFTVNPDKNVCWCHGCLRGGDVIELARFAWGYDKSEVAIAAAQLLTEFGHPIPERPAAWFRKQKRQRPVREAIEEEWVEHYARRIYRRLFLPSIKHIADADERREEVDRVWDACLEIACIALAGKQEKIERVAS